MLSYEEELELSDKLVARRAVRDQLEEGEEPTAEQSMAIREGDAAAKELVDAYLPYIYSTAKSQYMRLARSGTGITVEDLANEGVVAAMRTANAFNARGSGERRGVRFASYAGMAITKAIKRYIHYMSTPMRVDVSVIQASWVWLTAKSELSERLGREPSDEELEDHTSISVDYVLTDLPHRAEFMDISSPEATEIPGIGQLTRIAHEDRHQTAKLHMVLREVFQDDIVDVLMSYLGVDRYYPRSIEQVAEHMGMTKSATHELVGLASDALRHPLYRVRLRRAVESVESQLGA